MAAHLKLCAECWDLVCRLPRPVYYALGRPVPSVIPMSPLEIEAEVRNLVSHCLERLPGGGTVVVAAEWPCEALMLHVLSLSATRLRRLGRTAEIAETVFRRDEAPPRPSSEVAILLEAPYYPSLHDWTILPPGRVSILAGPLERWPTSDVDVRFAPRKPSEAVPRLEPYRQAITDALRGGGASVAAGIVANALGCDLPPGYLPPGTQGPFVPVTDLHGNPLGWSSVEGQWLAWQVVNEFARESSGEVAHLLVRAVEKFRSLGQSQHGPARRLARSAIQSGLISRLPEGMEGVEGS